MAPFISFLFSFFFPVLEILSVSNPSALSKDIELTRYPHTAVRRMWVYRVNSSATHPLRDQSFSFWSYSLFAPVQPCALKSSWELLRALESVESDLGISRHLCNVRHVVVTLSRFYSIHPSAPTVEVQQNAGLAFGKHIAHTAYTLWIYIANLLLWQPK